MTEPTPAETIRAAATRLREAAEKATPGPWIADPDTWHPHGDPLGYRRVVSGEPNPISGSRAPHLHTALLVPPGSPEDRLAAADAGYAALVNPVVGLAVADWLDVTARDVGTSSIAYHAALAVARALLAPSSEEGGR